MKQNKYDDPAFFTRYSAMPRSVSGLEAAGEWYMLREMLPNLQDRNVLDLGCGFGWHCRFAREQGARHVVGVDLSARMLERAREMTGDAAVEYRHAAIEDIEFVPRQFDVILSSLALHYVADLAPIFQKVHRWLSSDGTFVFSTEYSVFTACAEQDWHYGPGGERLHWAVDDYQHEGVRHSTWMSSDTVKYHRTFATILNTLLESGLQITQVAEPPPHPDRLVESAEWRDELRRPMFLLIAAKKP